MSFQTFKTAYHTCDLHQRIDYEICEGVFMKRFSAEELPENWDVTGHGISGASGFIILFECSELIEQWDLDEIDQILYAYEHEECFDVKFTCIEDDSETLKGFEKSYKECSNYIENVEIFIGDNEIKDKFDIQIVRIKNESIT